MAFATLFGKAYDEWVKRSGISVHDNVELRFSKEAGYHVVAATDIPAGSELVSVPYTACLNVSPHQPRLTELRNKGLPPLCLSAVVLADFLQSKSPSTSMGDLGAHAAILKNIFPENTVLSWTPREETLLQHTSLENALKSFPAKQRFEELVLPYLGAGGHSFSLTGEDMDELMHAAKLVMSRCFHAPISESTVLSALTAKSADATDKSFKDDAELAREMLAGPFVVPVCDFFNYHPGKCSTQLALIGDKFVYESLRDIKAGEEIYVSYGNLSDAQLLHTYGFVTDAFTQCKPTSAPSFHWGQPNPYNTVNIPPEVVFDAAVDVFSEDMRRAKLLKRILKTADILPATGFTLQLRDEEKPDSLTTSNEWLKALVPTSILSCLYVSVQDYDSLLEVEAGFKTDADNLPLVQTPSDVIVAIKQALTNDSTGPEGEGGSVDDLIEELELTAEIWELLLSTCAAALKNYPTDVAKDESWLQTIIDSKSDSAPVPIAGTKRKRGKPGDIWALDTNEAAELARRDFLYLSCRLVAMREKYLLKFVCQCIADQLSKVAAFSEALNDSDST